MSTTRIASVHFAPLELGRPFRMDKYKMVACPLGAEPVVMDIYDLIQRDWGSILSGTSKRQEHRWLVAGEEIARDLVGEWSGVTTVGVGMTPNCHPGVWVVRDKIPVTQKQQKLVDGQQLTFEETMVLDASNRPTFREATPDEFREMWAEDLAANRDADRHYAEWCWAQGNQISDDDKHNQLIPKNYRIAAKHYGLEASWLKEAAAMDSANCPSCGRLVSKKTFICGYCQQPTDLPRWAAWTAQKDAALREAKGEVKGTGKLPSPQQMAA